MQAHKEHHAGYYPGARELSLKLVYERPSGRLLGAQAFGHAGVEKRIDVLASKLPVEVSLNGTVLASTTNAQLLLETHLPVRYYLPREDVALDLLVPTETRSTCAYKGHASYFSTADGRPEGRDIAWTYPAPLDDALRVRDHVAFWNERTDIRVDGELQRRPVTPWSTPAEQESADADRLEFG